jgi:2-aminoethylphosphonate-pyruvate transaminase
MKEHTPAPLLMNPGPVTLSERVRSGFMAPDICHREPEFSFLLGQVRDGLVAVHPADGIAAVVLTGSGTLAVEAMLSSFVARDAEVLCLANGPYGERLRSILDRFPVSVRLVDKPWGERFDMDEVASRLSGCSHAVMVHHDTATGRLNDVSRVGELCRAQGVPLLVDAVSSFGAESLDMSLVAACAATANKCLHGAPGISFVVGSMSLFAESQEKPRSVYLDLRTHLREQQRGSTAFTQATHVLNVLNLALTEHAEGGGWTARHARYRELNDRIRSSLMELGVEPLLDDDERAVSLSAFELPKGVSYEHLHDGLKAAGFVIYAGQGPLAGSIFRIANMGAISDDDVDRFLQAFRRLV